MGPLGALQQQQEEEQAVAPQMSLPGPQSPLAALSQQAKPENPLEVASQRLGALTAQMGPIDQLRRLGGAMLPTAEQIIAQRQRARAAMEELQRVYVQQPAPYDPMMRFAAAVAGSPRRAGTGAAIGAGLASANEARELNTKMRSAREAAAAQAGATFENQQDNELVNQAVVAGNMIQAGQPRQPKQFSTIVNEVLERRNQVFDKLQKLGVDASTPDSMRAIEARIDREIAPLVKALWAEYPQYRDLLTQSMPQVFYTYGQKGGDQAASPTITPVTPALRVPESDRGPAVLPQGDFAPFIEANPGPRNVGGMQFKDKAQDAARKANAEAASKYFSEVVMPGADSGTSIVNAVQELKAIGPNPGLLAPLKKHIGRGLEAFGFNAGIVDEAIRTGNAEMVLQRMANAVLMAAKGVQTEGDAQRAFQQAAMITDPKESWDYKLRAMQAAAERLRYRQQLYREHSQVNRGNFDGAEAAFYRFETDVPFVKELPTRTGQTRAVFFNEFLDARMNQGVSRAEAMKEWKELK